MQTFSISHFFDILSQSQKVYSRYLEPVCQKWDLTRSELDVLLFLYNNPQYDRAADIVSHRGMAKSHVSLSVTNLTDRKFLDRRFSDSDRRTVHLSLTDAGKEIAAEGRRAQEEFFAKLYEGVSGEELQQMNAITQKICRNIENVNKSLTSL